MPLAQDTYLKSAGNTVANTELFGLSQGLENVIGTGGASQGFTNADVKGPIPNGAFNDLVNYVEIPITVFLRNGSVGGNIANAFPPTSLIMPFAGSLAAIAWQTLTAHVIGVYRSDLCVTSGTIAASAGFVTASAVVSAPRFKKGEVLTVVNFVAGTPAPAEGSSLGDEHFEMPAEYWLWFAPEDP